MNKVTQFTVIIFGSIVIILFGCNIFGFFKFYSSGTTANEPNLSLNSKFFVSNLLEPKKGDFIGFEWNDERLGNHNRIYRLVATEGDIVEIKKGILFVNESNFDEIYNLCYSYKVSNSNYLKLKEKDVINEKINETLSYFLSDDDKENVIITLTKKNAVEQNIQHKRVIDTINAYNKYISEAYKQDWNKDNFGPLKILKDHFFVLGDNRDNAEDSRFIGQVGKEKLKGVVVFKL